MKAGGVVNTADGAPHLGKQIGLRSEVGGVRGWSSAFQLKRYGDGGIG